MPLQRTLPNYYADSSLRAASSTGAVGVDFGFPARVLRVLNESAQNAYINPASTALCTTDDLCVRACSELVLTGVAISALAVYSTTTGATVQALSLAALGG